MDPFLVLAKCVSMSWNNKNGFWNLLCLVICSTSCHLPRNEVDPTYKKTVLLFEHDYAPYA